ncbi:MAG: hypothetical protein ACLUI3_08305 [Christensenellales bacterium]
MIRAFGEEWQAHREDGGAVCRAVQHAGLCREGGGLLHEGD